MRLKIFTLICCLGLITATLRGQARPTADRAGDLQIGGMFTFGNTDYRPENFKGYGFYTTYDYFWHLGIEGAFHQINDPQPVDGVGIFERTYEAGPRYVWHRRRYAPYGKVMYGRGVFQYPHPPGDPKPGPAAILAYNILSVGVGFDYHVRVGLNVRGDFEYQRWLSFPPNGLTPKIASIGVAYRFH